ncbi:unnamed protein product [Effrenium voratum]|nr:unnamed protein product [Effrenium voratum]
MASPGSASKRQRTSEYYRVIDGVKYDRSLLTAAEQFAEMGQITLIEAMELWKEAMDGNRVTPTERQTLKYVLAQFSFTEKARNFLEQQLRNARSYYRTINGVKYDRALLDRAESYPEAVTQQQAMELWHHAIDAERLSECGQRSLRYVLRHVKVTGGAKKLLETKPGVGTGASKSREDPGRSVY